MTNYYAKTYFWQNDVESSCHFDFSFEGKSPTEEELINHIEWVLEEGSLENNSNPDEEDFYIPDTHGLSLKEFATQLVKNEEERKKKGVKWELSTNLDEAPNDETWEHPCNL